MKVMKSVATSSLLFEEYDHARDTEDDLRRCRGPRVGGRIGPPPVPGTIGPDSQEPRDTTSTTIVFDRRLPPLRRGSANGSGPAEAGWRGPGRRYR